MERHIRMVIDAIMCKLGAGQHPVRPGRARPRARAVPAAELLAFLDADHPLRDKTLWWLAVPDRRPRQGEVLALNIADLGPGAPARRGSSAGGGRAEVIGWETKTARCCPDTCTAWASLAIYAKPTFDAVAAATGALDPDRRR